MQGIYYSTPETNQVSRVYSVAAVLYLQFKVHVCYFAWWMLRVFTLVLSEVCAQCPVWPFAVLPWFLAFPVLFWLSEWYWDGSICPSYSLYHFITIIIIIISPMKANIIFTCLLSPLSSVVSLFLDETNLSYNLTAAIWMCCSDFSLQPQDVPFREHSYSLNKCRIFSSIILILSTRVDYFRLSISVYCYRLLSIIVDPGMTDWRNCSPKACYVKSLLKGLFAHIIHALIHGFFQRWLSLSLERYRRCTAIRLRCAVLCAPCWSVSSALACTSQTRCYVPIT